MSAIQNCYKIIRLGRIVSAGGRWLTPGILRREDSYEFEVNLNHRGGSRLSLEKPLRKKRKELNIKKWK